MTLMEDLNGYPGIWGDKDIDGEINIQTDSFYDGVKNNDDALSLW